MFTSKSDKGLFLSLLFFSSGILQAFVSIVRNEGPLATYKGVTATVLVGPPLELSIEFGHAHTFVAHLNNRALLHMLGSILPPMRCSKDSV